MNSLKNTKFFRSSSLLLLVVIFPLSVKVVSDVKDFVQTSSGKVITQKKSGIFLWEDIPFALPPEGELRWKAPKPFINDDI